MGTGCRFYRYCGKPTPGLPVIVLSARGEVTDRIAGLDNGADDYLIKPFDVDEMFARIRAVRRRPAELVSEEIHVGALGIRRHE